MQPTVIHPTNGRPTTTLAHDQRHLFRLSRPNVLIIGPDRDLDAAIAAIVGCPAESVASWPTGTERRSTDEPNQTMIVRNVMALDSLDQQRLNRWLDEQGEGVRVIATTPAPIYPMVAARKFLEPLYYRLNVVCVEPGDLDRAGCLS